MKSLSNSFSYTIISCSVWWWSLLLSSLVVSPVFSGPLNFEGPSREVANNSLTDFDLPAVSKGCRYKALFYSNGEEVSTDEPCLACQCKGTVVVCKLRICAEIPEFPPPGCIVVHKAKSCCSQLVCHNGQEGPKKISREQRFPVNISNETLLASVSNETKDTAGYCVLDGTVYAEGSAMRSSTLCEYCFCIRGEMKCSSPQCVIPLNGCKPKFRSYACCPTNYDCGQSNETAVLKTVPSSTQVPQFLKGCLVNNQFVPEGEPVLPVQLAGGFGNSSGATNLCQTCFCMGGVVHCRPLECDKPIDGCSPIKEVGHCCPDRYDCSKPAKQKSISTVPTTITAGYPVQSFPTTDLYLDDEELGGGTTEASVDYTKPGDNYVPVSTIGAVYDDEPTTTLSSRRLDSEDSFERIAMIITGSSEESTSMPVSAALKYQTLTQPQLPEKRARISTTTVGGFKNRSDLGSREERRSKDADELSLSPKQLLQQSTEDDEREEEYYGFPPVFDTTLSNAIEDLGGATTVLEDVIPEESTAGPDADQTVTDVVDDERMTTDGYTPGHDDQEETTQPNTVLNDEQMTTEATVVHSSVETAHSSSGAPSSLIPAELLSTSTAPSAATTSTSHSLEFIPFVEEDALLPFENDTSNSFDSSSANPVHLNSDEIDTNFGKLTPVEDTTLPLLKPLELKFFNGTTEESFIAQGSTETEDAIPILVEKGDGSKPPTEFNLGKNNGAVPPGSSSLYSNGYYPHGSIIKDDDGPADELLQISEGEVPSKKRGSGKVSLDDVEESSAVPPTTTETMFTTKKAELPLKAISSIDKFIPSYAPVTLSSKPDVLDSPHPSRTYSKFGIQDAPLYRYDHHNAPPLDGNGFGYNSNKPSTNTAGIYHHRYYNEPEEIPTSRVQNPYSFYSTNPNTPSVTHKHRGGQQGGMLPHVYKNNQFFYEDSSAALDSYEEEYDAYLQPPTGGGNINSIASTPSSSVVGPRFSSSSTPRTSTSSTSTFQFLGERVRLPSYNQQRATSTPKYKYAHFNNQRGTTSYHKLGTSTERSTAANSDYHHHNRPLAAFPFSLPRSQDDNLLKNLGIKLSGCNVVGKMYSVGEVIEELSGDCLRCMCSDIGVHCAERKC